VVGFFTDVDEGDRHARNLLGFGLGQSKISTRVFLQSKGPVTFASGTVSTKTNVNVTMLPGIAAIREGVVGTVEEDAQRIAEKIADVIAEVYQRRAWRR